jgi:hypothetical protein
MPVSREILKKAGVTPEDIKPMAEKFDKLPDDDKFKKWLRRESGRIRDGVDRNLKNWRLWWALDKAMDAPFHQISYTLLRDIVEKDYDDKQVESLIEDFGVAHLLTDTGGDCTGSNGKKTLNIPVFFNIFVPLCAAYLKVRWAKLFNDRNNIPLYKYEPAYSTKENRLRCDIITSRVSVMSSQLGYVNDEKDSIFQSLHYGISIAFPRESWYTQKQKGSDGKVKTVREGLRFNMPPPERMYYDMSERLSTLNSNTGVSYIGHWHIAKAGDILDNPDMWNRDKISYGNEFDLISSSPNFFANIYPCTERFPSGAGTPTNAVTGTGVDQANDREKEYAKYTTQEKDMALLVTEHFTTVIPKDVGIGEYEYPVTFRMLFSNYDTPVYIEPMYCQPGAYYGYDSEGNRAKNPSLTLEIMPFQDQVSNILTQWILAVKKNLRAGTTFVDTDVVKQESLQELKNMGEKALRGTPYIEFSSRDMRAQMGDVRQAFHSIPFQPIPTNEMQQLIRGILDMLERALQFSAQEIGQAATHEQSATESSIINNNIGNRVRFTGTYIDDGQWAKKRMIYDALMACGDDDIYAEVGMGYAETKEEFEALCKKLKIEIVDSTEGGRYLVKASKEHLLVDAFVANRDGDNRINNPALATAASQVLNTVASNPVLFQAIGPSQVVELLNQISSLLDLPKDFRLKFDAKAMEQMTPEIVKQMQEEVKGVVEQIASRIEQGEKAVAKAIQDGDKQVAEGTMQAVEQVATQSGEAIKATQEAVVQSAEQIQQTQAAVQQVAEQVAMLQQALAQVAQQPPQQIPVPIPVPA